MFQVIAFLNNDLVLNNLIQLKFSKNLVCNWNVH